jgi:hypothetical protein
MKFISLLVLLLATSICQATTECKVIVGFGPGGGTDFVVRTLINDANTDSSLNCVVENKPGAGGVIAVRTYFENPDKKVLGVSGGQIFYETLNAPENNFLDKLQVIGPVLYSPMTLGTSPTSKIKKIDDLFDTRISKMQINVATAGAANELLVTILKKYSHHDIVSVRFKSTNDAYTALMGGHVDLQSAEYGFFKIKQTPILGIAGKSIDNIPSLTKYAREANIINFFGLAVSKDNPAPLLEKAVRSSFVKNDRKNFFVSSGYLVDTNERNDFLEREMLPKHTFYSTINLK